MDNTHPIEAVDAVDAVDAVEADLQVAPVLQKTIVKKTPSKRVVTQAAPVANEQATLPVTRTPAVKKVDGINKTATKKTAVKKPAIKKIAVKKPAIKKSAVAKIDLEMTEPTQIKPIVQALQISNEKVKLKKPKLVRDSFTIPENEYQVLDDLKKRCLKAGIDIKKSDLIRIGIASLKVLSVAQLGLSKDQLQKLKVGRPKK